MDSDKLSKIFFALSDPGRLKMFKLLSKKSDACVTDIANEFGISVPAASQHLKILEQSGLVERERNGQKICYHASPENKTTSLISKIISNA